MRIVREWLEDFLSLELSDKAFKDVLEALNIPVKDIIYPEGEREKPAVPGSDAVFITDDEITIAYEDLARLLSINNGFPCFIPEPFVKDKDFIFPEKVKRLCQNVLKNEGGGRGLLFSGAEILLPDWLERRLSAGGFLYKNFADAVLLYVNAETGSDICVKKLSLRAFSPESVAYLYVIKENNDINSRALKRIRQLWEQHSTEFISCTYSADSVF